MRAWRMRTRWRQAADAEAASRGRWAGRDSTGEIVDPGPGRALGERALDARHGLDLALDLGLDPAVRRRCGRSRDALADGGVLHEVAEADALDAAADEITTGDDHESGAPVPPGTGTPHKDGMRRAWLPQPR